MLHVVILYVWPPVCQVAPWQEHVLFGEKLRKLRQHRGLSQGELAHQLGLSSHSHLSNIEGGRRTASLEVTVRAAYYFGVSLDYLIRDTISLDAVTEYPCPATPQASAPQQFGSKLRTLRRQRSLLQTELGTQLDDLSQSHISLLEVGQKDPSLAVVIQIADFFGVTIDYLMRDEIPINGQQSSPGEFY